MLRFYTSIAPIVALLALAAVAMTAASHVAYAAPAATTSRYAGNLTGNCNTDYSNFYSYGQSQGQAGQLGRLVLDFGAQWYKDGSWGVRDWQSRWRSSSQVDCAVRGFIDGFWAYSASSQILTIGIGTNNSYNVSYQGGQIWANLQTTEKAYINSRGFSVQLSINGANDIEPSWSSASSAANWANGYSANTTISYVDYGSADGCPSSGTNQYSNGLCGNSWHQSDVEYASWGATHSATLARNLPCRRGKRLAMATDQRLRLLSRYLWTVRVQGLHDAVSGLSAESRLLFRD